MKILLKIYKWLILSVTLQLIFLIYMDNIYLTRKQTITETPYEHVVIIPKDERLELPYNAEDIEVSFDSKYICYRIEEKLQIINVEKRKIVKEIGYGEKYITEYKWLPDRDIIIYAYRQDVGNKTEIQPVTLDLNSNVTKELPKIKNLSYGSFVDSIELSPLTNVIYVKTIQKNGGSKIYSYDIMFTMEYVLDLDKGAKIRETAYYDNLIYENNNSVYVRDGISKRKNIIPIKGNAKLLEVDSEDNVYIGIKNTKGQIKSIVYGKIKELLAKDGKSIELENSVVLKDIIVTKEGRIFENDEKEKLVKDLVTFEEIKYKGILLEIKKDSIISKDGNKLEINVLKD